jgi:Flp pilus assembly secretin CpaC
MRHAAHSLLLVTAAVFAASTSTAGDSKVAPPANLRGTTAPTAAAAKQNMPVPVQTKEIASVAVAARKPAGTKVAAAPRPGAHTPAAKHADVKQVAAKPATKHVAHGHADAKPVMNAKQDANVTAAKHSSPKHTAAKRPQMKHVAHFVPSHGIAVPLDEVRVVQFSQPITTVYVGNPAIADVSVIDSRHVFVLGKAFGETNMVALNADGKQVTNDHVSIFGHTGSMVTLHRGPTQMTYSCASSRCEAAPTPGDDKDSYTTRLGQAASHQEWGLKSAGLTSDQSQSH